MLKINQDLLAIDHQIDMLVKAILETPQVQTYRTAKAVLTADSDLQEKILQFQNLQESYEEQKNYVNFRPEVAQLRRQVLAQKRQIDMTPCVQDLRLAEVALQKLLADLTTQISQAVSPDIFVDTGLPFAPHKRQHGHGRGENIREKG
ncbi:YlbF family regulator [Streptococcus dentasini]